MLKKLIKKKLELCVYKYLVNDVNIAIAVEDLKNGEQWAILTKYFDELKENELAIDVNNYSDAEEIINHFKVGTFTGKYVYSGFSSYPIYKVNQEFLDSKKF